MGLEHAQPENSINSQQLLLCGRPLDFHHILHAGTEVSMISGNKLKPAMKMARFEDDEGSNKGYDVYVSEDTIFIAPIGVDPRTAYLDPRSPLVFTAHAPRWTDTVVFTARTRHTDDRYDSRLPRGRVLLYEAMRFLDSTHSDAISGKSTIRTMEAEFVEPGYTSFGPKPQVASDNYTQFMQALDAYVADYIQRVGRRPHQIDLERAYKQFAEQTWATKYAAAHLGFVEIKEARIIPSASPSDPKRIGVWYERPANFTSLDDFAVAA